MSDLAFAPNGTPYVVLNNGHWLRVLAYSGGSWTQVGSNVNGTDDGVDYSTITVGNDGSVYVLSMDKSGGSTSLGKLMRYNGSSWSQV